MTTNKELEALASEQSRNIEILRESLNTVEIEIMALKNLIENNQSEISSLKENIRTLRKDTAGIEFIG